MANRVTADEVKEIIDTDMTSIDAFITAANLIVTNRLSDSTMTAATLKEIERWLAAHLIAVKEPILREERIGDATDVFAIGPLGKRLEMTPYGQQALLLDSTGILLTMGKKPSKVEWIGTTI